MEKDTATEKELLSVVDKLGVLAHFIICTLVDVSQYFSKPENYFCA